ncbi:unnamed protein product [Caenorhabditis brenneri]
MEEEIQRAVPGMNVRNMITHLQTIPIYETQVPQQSEEIKVIREERRRDPDTPWNCTYRILLTQFVIFMAMGDLTLMQQFALWSQRENGWLADEIPRLPFDRASLRIQIWAGNLPNPKIHAQQVLIRVPWMGDAVRRNERDNFVSWFVENARGAPEVLLPQSKRPRRCQMCSSNILGYPIQNHHWSKCIFMRLNGIQRLKWMAINTRSFCSRCGSWSTTHHKGECVPTGHRPCMTCNKPDHQTFQELCGYDLGYMTERDQDNIAYTTIREHYATCRNLAENSRLAYRCQSDYPDPQTYALLLKLRQNDPRVLIGWCKHTEHMRDVPSIRTDQYTLNFEFKGLHSPEVSSSDITSTIVFPPEEIDRVCIYGMILDQMRFNSYIFRNRKGNEPMLVERLNLGDRARLRRGPLFQAAQPPPIPPPAILQVQVNENHGARVQPQPIVEFPESLEIPAAQGAIVMADNPVVEVVEGNPNGGETPQAGSPEDRPQNPTPGRSRPHDQNPADEFSDDGWGRESRADPEPTEQPLGAIENGPEGAVPEEPKEEESPEDQSNESPTHSTETSSDDQGSQRAQHLFNRNKSVWFQFKSLQVMSEQGEVDDEKKFINKTSWRCKVDQGSKKVLSSQDALTRICDRAIPHHSRSIKLRIDFLLSSLTGDKQDTDVGAIACDDTVLKEYISYLQGIHRFIKDIDRNERFLSFRVSSCWHAVQSSPAHQVFHVANLELFHSMTPDVIFGNAESHWSVYAEQVGTSGCECHRKPE